VKKIHKDKDKISSGVRQGSVLSAFLFAVYVDDIAKLQNNRIGTFIILYADYGRPLSVSGRPCYILPMFFLFIFLWPPYSPEQGRKLKANSSC